MKNKGVMQVRNVKNQANKNCELCSFDSLKLGILGTANVLYNPNSAVTPYATKEESLMNIIARTHLRILQFNAFSSKKLDKAKSASSCIPT